jgi:RNA polymerase sigma factor (sigma-70 family)
VSGHPSRTSARSLEPDRARGEAQSSHFDDNRLYERVKCEARKTYQRAFGTVEDDQWDEAFNMSYWKLCQAESRCPGTIEHPASWIATIAKNEIVSERRKTARQTSFADRALALTDQHASGEQDALNAIERRHVLRDLGFILNQLPVRQKLVWSARFVWDYSPEEIQERLGLSRKAYEKALQQATSFLFSRLERARKGICATPEMESLVRGYAIWGARHYSAKRGALARAHLDDCPACKHTAWVLRSAAREQRQPLPSEPAMSATEVTGSPNVGQPRVTHSRMDRGLSGPARRRAHVLAG